MLVAKIFLDKIYW